MGSGGDTRNNLVGTGSSVVGSRASKTNSRTNCYAISCPGSGSTCHRVSRESERTGGADRKGGFVQFDGDGIGSDTANSQCVRNGGGCGEGETQIHIVSKLTRKGEGEGEVRI